MMQGEHIEHFLEDSPRRDSKLHEVFNKISDIWQQQHSVSNKQKMSSEIIETILPERNSIPISGNGYQGFDESDEDCGDSGAVQALARRLEDVLRAAKSAQLDCGGVLLPADLLPRIARDVLRMAENEPCGLKGCKLYINFEMEQECRRLSSIKCDKNTVSTFELFLTLKQDASSWHSILPQFLKNLAKPRTIVISPGFTLEKKKLYRSYTE